MTLQLEQGKSRANAQALVCSSSLKKDRGLSVAQSLDFFFCLLWVSVNPKLECQRSSGNRILNDPLKERPHWPVGTVCWSGCTPGTGSAEQPIGQVLQFSWWTTHTRESSRKASEEEKQRSGTMWVTVPRLCGTAGTSSRDRKFQGRHSKTRVPFCHRALDRCLSF